MTILSFKPGIISRKLITPLDERARIVVQSRFGIGDFPERKTLESIGDIYGITRERVRQIENASIEAIRKHPNFELTEPVFNELKETLEEKKGGVVAEHHFLESLSDDKQTKNHIHFLLVLGKPFIKIKEDDYINHTWTTEEKKAKTVHDVLRALHKKVAKEETISEEELFSFLKKNLTEKFSDIPEEEILRSWLHISKAVDKNILGEWGSAGSPIIHPKSTKDLAYLVLKKQGSPMHFSEVANFISNLFSRKAHSETVHNELIKDGRFVLVGRGLYALNEWGYKPGVIRDVIADIIKSSGPLTKEEIVKRVLKERYVKENTILVNLQNKNFFRRAQDRKYNIG